MASELMTYPITYIKLNGKRPHVHINSKFSICAYCAESIQDDDKIIHENKQFCSIECVSNWKRINSTRIQETCSDIKICFACAVQINNEVFCTYDGNNFCSEDCYKNWEKKDLLNKCKSGEISYLDLPKELRDKERNSNAHKCISKTCPECGTIFYTASYYGEDKKKYCSKRCSKIALKRSIDKNWWKTFGWMSSNWKGGISNGIYCQKFNADLRRRVRAFFGNKCFLCGKPQSENPKKLAVHHVNYNKNACCDSSRVLLVPLCEVASECAGWKAGNYEKPNFYLMACEYRSVEEYIECLGITKEGINV